MINKYSTTYLIRERGKLLLQTAEYERVKDFPIPESYVIQLIKFTIEILQEIVADPRMEPNQVKIKEIRNTEMKYIMKRMKEAKKAGSKEEY